MKKPLLSISLLLFLPAQGAYCQTAGSGPIALPRVDLAENSGGFSYSLPFPKLPTRGDQDPGLEIKYQPSRFDLGQGLGVGWSVPVSAIEISGDAAIGSFEYKDNTSDKDGYTRHRLLLDGENLSFVSFDGVHRTVEYSNETRGQRTRIFRHLAPFEIPILDSQGKTEIRKFGHGFERIDTDGRRFVYSGELTVAEGLKIDDGDPGDPVTTSFVTRWPLVLEVMPGGNAIQYDYIKDGGTSYLSKVSFAGNQSSYQFFWNVIDRPAKSYRYGYRKDNHLLYAGVRACFAGKDVQTWMFRYENVDVAVPVIPDCDAPAMDRRAGAAAISVLSRAWDSISELARGVGLWVEHTLSEGSGNDWGVPRLKSIVRQGRSDALPSQGSSLEAPTLNFAYTDWVQPDSENLLFAADGFAGTAGFGTGGNAELFDVNRDGLLDLVSMSGSEAMAYVNLGGHYDQGNYAEAASFTIREKTDGSELIRTPQLNPGTQGSLFLRGDLDGDGWADILEVRPEGTVKAFLQQKEARSGFVADENYVEIAAFGDGNPNEIRIDALRDEKGMMKAMLVDVSGDGKDDLIYAVQNGQGLMSWAVLVNSTQGFDQAAIRFSAQLFSFPFHSSNVGIMATAELRFIDMNQDGLVDLIRPFEMDGSYGICVYENLGQANFPSEGTLPLFDGSPDREGCRQEDQFFPIPGLEKPDPTRLTSMWPLDINGDGQMDFADLDRSGRVLSYWLGRAQGDRYPVKQDMQLFADSDTDGKLSVDPENRSNTMVMDFDQDGAEEILVFDKSTKQVKVIDFNRRNGHDLLPSHYLFQAETSDGGTDRFHYTTSMQELRLERNGEEDALWTKSSYPYAEFLLKEWAHRSSQSLLSGQGLEQMETLRYGQLRWDFELAQPIGYTEVKRFTPGSELGNVHSPARLTISDYADRGQRYFAGIMTKHSIYEQSWTDADEQNYLASIAAMNTNAAEQAIVVDGDAKRFVPGILRREILNDYDIKIETATASVPALSLPERAFVFLSQETTKTCGDEDRACKDPKVEKRSYTYDDEDRVNTETHTGEKISRGDRSLARRSLTTVFTYDEESRKNLSILDNVRMQRIIRDDGSEVLVQEKTFDPNVGKVTKVLTTKSLPRTLADLPTNVQKAVHDHELTEEEFFGYDAYGNLLQRGFAESKPQIVMKYDEQGIFILKSTNALQQTSYFCFSSQLCLSSEFSLPDGLNLPEVPLLADFNQDQNGFWSYRAFDSLARVRELKDQAGYQETYHYAPFASDALNSYEVTKSGPANKSFGAQIFVSDSDGSEIALLKKIGPGETEISRAQTYNRSGLIAKQYAIRQEKVDLHEALPASRLTGLLAANESFETTSYDGLGRVRKQVLDGGQHASLVVYSPWGLTRFQKDQKDQTIGTQNFIGRTEGEWDAIIDENDVTQSFERDNEGHFSRIKLADENQARLYVYDSAGKLVVAHIPGLMSTVWAYDARGRLKKVTKLDGATQTEAITIQYEYDELDRVTQERSNGQVTRRFAYDSALDRTGEAIKALGYLVNTESINPNLGITDQYFYRRNAEGRLSLVEHNYLDAQRKLQATFTEHYEFQADGNLARRTSAHGLVFEFNYDALQELDSVVANKNPIYQKGGYDSTGMLRKGLFGKQLSLFQHFDPRSRRLNRYKLCRGAAVESAQDEVCTDEALADATLAYDDESYLVSINDRAALEIPHNAGYEYTPRHEISKATYDEANALFWSYTGGGQFKSNSLLDGAGDLEQGGEPIQPRSPKDRKASFDPWGRLKTFGSDTSLQWDAYDLTQNLESKQLSLSFAYGPEGERTFKRVKDGSMTKSYFAPFADSTVGPDEKTTTIALPMGMWAIFDHNNQDSLQLALEDENGMLRLRLKSDGSKLGSQRNSPFGSVLAAEEDAAFFEESSATYFRGQRRDRETGWIDFDGRFFVPELAAFANPSGATIGNPETCMTGSWMECRLYY